MQLDRFKKGHLIKQIISYFTFKLILIFNWNYLKKDFKKFKIKLLKKFFYLTYLKKRKKIFNQQNLNGKQILKKKLKMYLIPLI